MRRHLAAVDRLMGAHDLLDEGVARFGLHRDTALLRDNVLRIPNHSGVMNNLRAHSFSKKDGCKKAHDIFTWHKLTCFIEKEAAIKVTVKCHAKVGSLSLDYISRRRMVFRKKWIGDAIRECRIGRMMHADKF